MALLRLVVETKRDVDVWPTWQFVELRLHQRGLDPKACLDHIRVYEHAYAAVRRLDDGGDRDANHMVASLLGLSHVDDGWSRLWTQVCLDVIRAIARRQAGLNVDPAAVVVQEVKLSSLLIEVGKDPSRKNLDIVSSVLRLEPSVWHAFNGIDPSGDWNVTLKAQGLYRWDVPDVHAYFRELAKIVNPAPAPGLAAALLASPSGNWTRPEPASPLPESTSTKPAGRLRRTWDWVARTTNHQVIGGVIAGLILLGFAALGAGVAHHNW